MSALSIAILGPGAVGGFLAAALWKAGADVTCVARESTAALIATEGIHVDSAVIGRMTARPAALPRLLSPQDFLFVTTKATTLGDALQRVEPRALAAGWVVPLLNGVEHIPLLVGRFGPRVVPAAIQIEAKYLGPNRVDQPSPFARIEWALPPDPAPLLPLTRLLETSGIAVEARPSAADVLWSKLVRLNAIATATAASGLAVGQLRSDPRWRARLQACVGEGVRVARAEGLSMDAAEVMAKIDSLPPGLGTSLQRDVEAGRPSELDAIAGAVIRAGTRHGIDCPATAALVADITARMKSLPREAAR